MQLSKSIVLFCACVAAAGLNMDSAHAAGNLPDGMGALQTMCRMPSSTLALLKAEWVEIKTKSMHGEPDAQYLRGVFCDCGFAGEKNAKAAILWYRKSAAQDNAKAELALSLHYLRGIGLKKDMQKAFFWTKKAADQNYAPAQYSLAMVYANGEAGIAKNAEHAFELVHDAAKQNYLPAEYRLGIYYEHGFGTKPDKAEAATWFLRAADAGDGKSQAICGIYYATGTGVPASTVESAKWFMLARHNLAPHSSLHDYVSRLLSSVSKDMKPEDLNRAQTEVAAWLRLHHDPSAEAGN